MKVIFETNLKTVNRGEKKFIISIDEKGKYFAHEIGEETNWSKVFKTSQFKAHRLNPTVRRGNQYGVYLKPKGFSLVIHAKKAIHDMAQTNVQYF